MELMDAMLQRRSIRKYKADPVPAEKLEKILQAGLLAPTSKDRKPCEFYAVTDRETLVALSEAKAAGGAMLANAGAAIVVLADPVKADTWIEDSSIALAFMHLMAVDQGVGSCWIQIHMRKDAAGGDAEANVRKIMSAPDSYCAAGILSLGMPAEERPAKVLSELDYSKIHS